MHDATVTGSCLCSGVGFEIDGILTPIQYCHATRCRKASGSAFAAEAAARASNFRWTRGADLVSLFEAPLLREPPAYRHAFCRICGSPLAVALEGTDLVTIPAGVLNRAPDSRAFCHIFVGQNPAWHLITDDLPRFDGRAPWSHGLPRRSS